MTTDGADRFLPDEVPEDPDAVDTPWQAPEGASHQQLYTSDPSVFAEPWMQPLTHRDDPSDAGCSSIPTEASEDHSVWDEPGLSRALSGETPSDALTWFRWYRQRSQDTSVSMTWLVTVAVAAVAGLFAIVGTILVQSVGGTALMTISVIGPTTEEIMKIFEDLNNLGKTIIMVTHEDHVGVLA